MVTINTFQILSSKFAGNVFVNLIGTWAVSIITNVIVMFLFVDIRCCDVMHLDLYTSSCIGVVDNLTFCSAKFCKVVSKCPYCEHLKYARALRVWFAELSFYSELATNKNLPRCKSDARFFWKCKQRLVEVVNTTCFAGEWVSEISYRWLVLLPVSARDDRSHHNWSDTRHHLHHLHAGILRFPFQNLDWCQWIFC